MAVYKLYENKYEDANMSEENTETKKIGLRKVSDEEALTDISSFRKERNEPFNVKLPSGMVVKLKRPAESIIKQVSLIATGIEGTNLKKEQLDELDNIFLKYAPVFFVVPKVIERPKSVRLDAAPADPNMLYTDEVDFKDRMALCTWMIDQSLIDSQEVDVQKNFLG
jgi:hypothetical protein